MPLASIIYKEKIPIFKIGDMWRHWAHNPAWQQLWAGPLLSVLKGPCGFPTFWHLVFLTHSRFQSGLLGPSFWFWALSIDLGCGTCTECEEQFQGDPPAGERVPYGSGDSRLFLLTVVTATLSWVTLQPVRGKSDRNPQTTPDLRCHHFMSPVPHLLGWPSWHTQE